MPVINIRDAVRTGAKIVIGLQGVSGSGKTYTALQVGFGLAWYDSSKIGMLDTENGRGGLYADSLQREGKTHPFKIGTLEPPFSPKRYIEAIRCFEDAGCSVLIIDSVSHEWAGAGGCYDIAKNTAKRLDDWLTSKNEHKKFMSAMLQSSMHIICCVREAPKTDFSNPKEPKSLGLMPIQESQFIFEMTASLQMLDEGRSQRVIKCPADLRPYLGREQGYLTPEDGAGILAWVNGGQRIDPRVEKYRARFKQITESGSAALTQAWEKTPDDICAALGDDFLSEMLAIAHDMQEKKSQVSQLLQGGSND